MTRKAILELIKQRVKPSDSTEQFPLQYIQGMCDVVWSTWCAESIADNNQDMNFFTKLYEDQTVALHASGAYATTLPEQVLKLPRIGDGVMSVNEADALNNNFKPISEDKYRLMLGQETERTGTDIYFYVTYDKIVFSSVMDATEAAKGVDLRLSIPFSKYLLTEELPLPSGREMEFIGAVINLIQGTPDTNLTNKNSNE